MVHRWRIQLPYAIRKLKDYLGGELEDLVQPDALVIRPLPGKVFEKFNARDVICSVDILDIYNWAIYINAAHFLDTLEERVSFPAKAI